MPLIKELIVATLFLLNWFFLISSSVWARLFLLMMLFNLHSSWSWDWTLSFSRIVICLLSYLYLNFWSLKLENGLKKQVENIAEINWFIKSVFLLLMQDVILWLLLKLYSLFSLILGMPFHDFMKLNWIPVNLRLNWCVTSEVFKCISKACPVCLNEVFEPAVETNLR